MTYTLKVAKIEAGLDLQGKTKAVCYGPKFASTPITVDTKEFTKLYKEAGESSVISLQGLDEELDVLIHDVQTNPVTGVIIHADLYAIEKGKKITVHVPLVFVGVSNAVKALGADLIKVLHEVEVEAGVKDLPHEIEVDLSKLAEVEGHILVSYLPKLSGLEYLSGAEEVIALAAKHKEEEEEAPAEIDMSAIEVSAPKGKKEEEESAE